MKLKNCKMGVPVKNRDSTIPNKCGHIIGFSTNSMNEIIVVVQWQSKENKPLKFNTTTTHPANIERII